MSSYDDPDRLLHLFGVGMLATAILAVICATIDHYVNGPWWVGL